MSKPMLLVAIAALAAGTAGAQMSQRPWLAPGLTLDSGEAIYAHVCQACHMPDAKGAQGAAIRGYPALVGNPKLASAAYAAMVVVRGQKAMPAFAQLSDAQVAAVVNYLRSHFGNAYADAITAGQVAPLRPAVATAENRAPG